MCDTSNIMDSAVIHQNVTVNVILLFDSVNITYTYIDAFI